MVVPPESNDTAVSPASCSISCGDSELDEVEQAVVALRRSTSTGGGGEQEALRFLLPTALGPCLLVPPPVHDAAGAGHGDDAEADTDAAQNGCSW